LAWWSCDPRRLVVQQQQQQQQQQQDEQNTITGVAEAAQVAVSSAPDLQNQGGSMPAGSRRSSLGPCMTMPTMEGQQASHSAATMWLQALTNVPATDYTAAKDTAAAAAVASTEASGSQLAGWRVLPACCPAWEQVQPPPAQAAGLEDTMQQDAAAAASRFGLPAELLRHPLLCRAMLPCLRFFLRSSRDIRAAYIPDLEAWQQPAAAAT
jgi:hypothetical protein